MQRFVLATTLVFAVAGAALGSQLHSLPPEHVDSYAGDVILRSGVSGGMNYAGVYLKTQRRRFVYQAEELIDVPETRTQGIIEYWHTGFRLTLPAEKRAVILQRAGTRIPQALPPSPFDVTSYSNGYGIVHVQLPGDRPRDDRDGPIDIQDYCSPESSDCGPFDQDPIGGGGSGAGSGGSSCTPASCSIGCASGTCEAACGSGYKAVCKCNESNLTAACYCTRC